MAEPAGLAEVSRSIAARLNRAGVSSPAVDAELLLAHVLGIGRGELAMRLLTAAPNAQSLDSGTAAELESLVLRREKREPLQHVLGSAPFRRLELRVGPGVFVPRPETESIVDLVFGFLPCDTQPTGVVVDLGTGSGAIALSVASEAPATTVWAVEASPVAFTWAKTNMRLAGVDNVHLIHDDFLFAVPELADTVDVVVSNPPYVPLRAVPRDVEVRLHDPELALYSGEDGLDAIRVIAQRAIALVRPGGAVVLEHGEEQGEAVREILNGLGWSGSETHRDLTGRDRFTSATRPAR